MKNKIKIMGYLKKGQYCDSYTWNIPEELVEASYQGWECVEVDFGSQTQTQLCFGESTGEQVTLSIMGDLLILPNELERLGEEQIQGVFLNNTFDTACQVLGIDK